MSVVVPLSDQIKCAEREVALRKRAYPKWVQSGRMKRETADYEIAAMEAVLASLRALFSVQATWL
jgi:hypothetical protein